MPLKVLELRSQLDAAIIAANAYRDNKPDFAAKRTALKVRQDELDKRNAELPDDAPDSVRAEIDSAVTQLEADAAALDAEESGYTAEQERLDGIVADLNRQIAEIEKRNEPDPAPEPAQNNTKEVIYNMPRFRSAALRTREALEKFMTREDSKRFIQTVQALGNQGRSVENLDKTMPDSWLDVLHEELPGASKLLKYVRYRKIKGTGRQPMTGAVPEAVWIGACDHLNASSLGFNDVEYDVYAVGAYIKIPKIYLASDSVVDLGAEIMDGLINAIGVGADKAILYGTNVKMPLGVVTRLAQTSEPTDESISYPWEDLHSTNIITIAADKTGANFFYELALAKKALKKKRFPTPHGIVWCMNSTTHAAVDAEATLANVLAVGTNQDGTDYMPILKGVVEELDFIPDNNIVVGFFDLYGYGDREGGEVDNSDIPFFLENARVYKAVAYADGMPLCPSAFAVIGIGGTNPTTVLSFQPDYANTDLNTLTVTAAAGSAVGKTVLTVSGKLVNTNTLKYKCGLNGPAVGTAPDATWSDLTSGSTAITAAAGAWITVAELDSHGNVVGTGYVQSVPKTN